MTIIHQSHSADGSEKRVFDGQNVRNPFELARVVPFRATFSRYRM